MTCSSCGHSNRAGRKFCANCGTLLALACPECGAANEQGERFCGECGAPLAAPDAAAAPTVERRLVSILFVDLVGSTARAESRDAEDVREQLTRYFDVSRQVVERYGGTIEKFIGDAVMAVWGTPAARKDDAERAVRAAVELRDAVAGLGLTTRAGVATGEAAVAIGAEGQGMVAGDLVNTASRIQSAAEAGDVLVAESTMRATEAAIAYADAGAHELKGKAEPVSLWRALRITAGRGGALKSDGLEPPFVGRERELRLLKELFHGTATDRKAHVVSIVGIAGIGKSRLSWELYKYLDGLAGTTLWHRGRCLAYGEGVAYWALAEMVRMRAGIAEGENEEKARAKLEATLESVAEDVDERAWLAPRLAHLLALEERREWEQGELHAAWRLFFERLADRDPVVLLFEDVQWADAALLDFVDHLLDWSRNHAIFVLVLTRPEVVERHPGWQSARRNGSTLALEPLGNAAMEQLLHGVVPGLSADVRARVLARAEGVPLYAVETIRMLIARSLLERDGDAYRPVGPIEELEVPETLHALLASRLDSLTSEERQAAQDAAVLGKTFTLAAGAAVSGLSEGELEPLLDGLVRKEILMLQSDPRSPERGQYAFLQDLLRQVAYETLARRERKLRHLAAATHLGRESADEVAEVVAAHYVAAYRSDPDGTDARSIREGAAAAFIRAGERAASLGATEEAQRLYEQAIELTAGDLRTAELHERAGRAARLGLRPAESRTHLERSIALFEELGLTHPAARVRVELALLAWQHEHRMEEGVADLERAYAVLSGDEPDADVAMLAAQLGRLLHFIGRPGEALAPTERALEIAEALELPEVLSQALNTKGIALWGRGRKREGTLLLHYALEVALEHELVDATLRAYNNYGGVLEEADRYREAVEVYREACRHARRFGDRSFEYQMLNRQASPFYRLGEWDAAIAATADVPDAADAAADLAAVVIPIHVRRGDLVEARRALSGIAWAREAQDPQASMLFRSFESMILLAEGKPADALAVLEEPLARRADVASTHMVVWALECALEAATRLGDTRLDGFLGILAQFTPGETTRYVSGIAARYAALSAARVGDAPTAALAFTAAADAFREIETPFEMAAVELEHAEWLLGEGRLEEAEPLFAEAREIFERLQARPWLARLETARPAPVSAK